MNIFIGSILCFKFVFTLKLIYNRFLKFKSKLDIFSMLYILLNILYSSYMSAIEFKDLDTFIIKHQLDDKKEEIFDILIDLLISDVFLTSHNILSKYQNILNYILNNKETLSTQQKIKLYGFTSIVIFCEKYYNHGYIDNLDSLNGFFKKVLSDIQNIYINIDVNLTEKIDIDILFKVDEIINTKLLNILNLETSIKIIDDNEYNIHGTNINGIELKNFIRNFRLCYINIIKNNIKKDKNIEKFYQLNIFKYDNFILTYDEKTDLFDNSYSGRITNKDIEMFISHHNQIANHIMKNNVPTENMAKIAFNCGNINFIEYLINKKYTITTKHLTYLLNYNKNNLNKLIQTLNKYNTINYFDNFDWYYHLHYLFPDINILELIFSDDNKELQKNLKDKIENNEYNKYNINLIKKLDEMDYINFIEYYKNSSEKIKLSTNDIIKFKDYKKQYFLLNYNK